MRNLLFITILFIPTMSWSQDSHPLTQGEVNKVLINAFNKLVSSNPNSGEIANYVSLDPVNASFNVKSTIPLLRGVDKKYRSLRRADRLGKDEGGISYLSFSMTGGLIDKNYGILFSNSSLNSGISLTTQYNFRIKRPKFTYDNSAWEDISLKRHLLLSKHHINHNVLEKNINKAAVERSKSLVSLQLLSSQKKLNKKQAHADLIEKSIDSLGSEINQRVGLGDTLRTLQKEITQLEKEINISEIEIDSINSLLSKDVEGQKIILQTQLYEKLKKNYDTLFTTASLLKIRTTWFTLIGGYSRKSYTTFDATLPFETQIGKGKLDAFNYGVAINHLIQDRLRLRTIFLNTSITRNRKNNLALLTTKTIEQSQQFTSTPGGPTRTSTNKYSVYTDPITESTALTLSAHGYFLFGKTPSGVHLFPSIDFMNDKKTIANLTLGYLISFRNTVKDQPIVNSELYFRFSDILDEENLGNQFYNRNEVGISFTVPFNIF